MFKKKDFFLKLFNQYKTTKKIPQVDLHTHTSWTDGKNTVFEMSSEAVKKKLETVLFSEHTRANTGEWFPDFVKEIKESIVIGQSWDNDIRIILFVIMNQKFKLNNKLINEIKTQIKKNASPRHVPSKILNVKDIPRTKNGKIVELAVKNIIEGNEIKNKEALANPEVLNEFKNLIELKY